MSLRWRFALLFAAGAAIVTLLVALAAFTAARGALNSEIDSSLAERRASLFEQRLQDLYLLAKYGNPLLIRVGGREEFRERGLSGRLFDPDVVIQWSETESKKTLISVEGAPALPVLIPGEKKSQETNQEYDTVRVGDASYRILSTKTTPDSVLLIARDITEQEKVLSVLAAQIALIGLLVATVAGAGGWLLARRITRPLEGLTDVAAEVARTRELLEPIDLQASGEVRRLADSFNSMIEALRHSRQRQHQLIQDASHELSTPLASLRTNVEVLERNLGMEVQEREKLLADIIQEIAEMTTLLRELVVLAMEQEQPDEPVQDTYIDEIVSMAVEKASRRSRRPVLITGQGAALSVRPRAIERAVSNLIDNAIKWGPPNQPVEVSLSGGQIKVRDHGPGLSRTDLTKIFDRFYRSVQARSTPGSGLGLAIVKEIVEKHGGHVHARNHPDGGAEVGFTLPL